MKLKEVWRGLAIMLLIGIAAGVSKVSGVAEGWLGELRQKHHG
jgi:hypothetical protein